MAADRQARSAAQGRGSAGDILGGMDHTEMMKREMTSAATPSPADTIRTALRGAMVGAWGRENALRALAEMEAENDRLRREIDSLRPHVEGIGYAG